MQMYRKLIVGAAALATVLTAVPAFAQNQPSSGFGIGALGGVNWTSVRTETNEFDLNTDAKNGFMLGIWFGGNRDGRTGLMGEVSFVRKKIGVSGFDPEEGDFEVEIERNYIQIPVLLRINAGSRDRDRPSLYFLVGPEFNIQINTKENGVDSPDDVYEGLEIALAAGVGFEVARIGIEGRYSWGLRSVLATDAAEEAGFGSTKLNTFSVLAKIRFN